MKDLYKEVEKEKKNKVKDCSKVVMSKEDYISEHKNLIKVLRSGDKKALEAEAVKQEKEMEDKVGDEVEDED
jgi:hypothetical protein